MQNFLTYWRGMIEHDGTTRLPADDAATSFIDARGYTLTGPGALTHHDAAALLSNVWNRPID